MTAAALWSKFPLMPVVGGMTGSALAVLYSAVICLVAVVAGEVFMCSPQGKIGLFLMVEYPQLPIVGGMAAFTYSTEGFPVGIFPRVTCVTGAIRLAITVVAMAGTAGSHCMHSLQREKGQFMVKTRCLYPGLGLVTGGAVLHLPITVHIVRCVAILTLLFLRIFQRPPVTAQAGELRVPPLQGPASAHTVVELRNRPVAATVTTATVLPMATAMYICLLMACDAFTGQPIPTSRIVMTGLARLPRVGTAQSKVCIHQVVEIGGVPCLLSVAAVALPTELPPMNINQSVAINAGCRSQFVLLPGMAGSADSLRVAASQRKIGLGVVKFNFRQPRTGPVAASTVLTQPTIMGLLFNVAGAALSTCIPEQLVR